MNAFFSRGTSLCVVVASFVVTASSLNAGEPLLEKTKLFEAGTDGYALYRIPGIVVTAKGTVLAYCEARRTGKSDWDTIDIYVRRSTDGGKTWGTRQKMADVPGPKTKNPVALAQKLANPDDVTYNNPVAIADRDGKVHFLFCLEYARCFYVHSTDDGVTWSKPVEITSTFEKFRPQYNWKVLATGPAHGIQLRTGRLVVPIWLSTGTGGHAHRPSITSVIFSDDGGQTWQPGEIAVPNTDKWIFPNETVVVELADGRVMLNVRSESIAQRRLIVTSRDGAIGWTAPKFDEALLEPICMASIVRFSQSPHDDKNRILFANPHNLERADGKTKPGGSRDRKNLSVKLSYDEGRTWPVNKSLEPGYSAYSDLTVLPDGTILCFYEHGRAGDASQKKPTSYAGLTLARFNLEWLTDGSDSRGHKITSNIDIGRQKQLLVDDYLIAEKSGVTRVLGNVTKANGGQPIFTEGWFYGTVLYHDERFKMWFRKPGTAGYGYAESQDGLRFEKRSDVTGIPFAGDYTLAVEFDRHETDSAHRFKSSFDAPGMAAGIAHSADGIQWTTYNEGKPVTGRAADTYNQILWDEKGQTYRLFTRSDFGTPGGSTELRGTRSLTNPDPKSRPTDWQVVRPWIFDKEGSAEAQRRQIYAVTCWPYENLYFALLSVYEFPGDCSEGKSNDFRTRHDRDVMNFYIATSRDGDSWDLHWVYASQPLIPRGSDGAFDKDLLIPASTIVTHDDKHWLYYAGANERHGTPEVHFDRTHAIGLATLPLDRFVGLQAKDAGTVVTRPFKLEGNHLQVNLDSRDGEVAVSVLDEFSQPITNYSGDDAAVAKNIDAIRWAADFKQSSDLSSLKNRTIRLQFALRNAQLYSVQMVD